MQIFLDSADINEINEIYDLGIINGVTTNPSLIAKSSKHFQNTVSEICKVVKGDVSVEVFANDLQGMIEQGEKILMISDNIVIKLPMTWEGVKACKYFTAQAVKVNMTLCFSSIQALVAAKVGATYISPFIGRLDDIGHNGMELIKEIRYIFNNYSNNLNTKILAASIRNVEHVRQSALNGADVITMPGRIIKQLLLHPLTEAGISIFNQDWEKSQLFI